jgi:hypothetical protein
MNMRVDETGRDQFFARIDPPVDLAFERPSDVNNFLALENNDAVGNKRVAFPIPPDNPFTRNQRAHLNLDILKTLKGRGISRALSLLGFLLFSFPACHASGETDPAKSWAAA